MLANTTSCFRAGKQSQGRETRKAPLQNPYWVGSYEIRSRNGTGAIWGQSESAVGSKRGTQQLPLDPHHLHTAPERTWLPRLPRKGCTPGAATDPAGFESQTLQACHLYLCPFPISRATACSNCLPRGENAKFRELT